MGMFTGIVEEIGRVKSFDGAKLVVECKKVLENTQIGDSIAIEIRFCPIRNFVVLKPLSKNLLLFDPRQTIAHLKS